MKQKILKWVLKKLYGSAVKELGEASELYAYRKFSKHYPGQSAHLRYGDKDGISREWMAYQMSFMDGYIKCMHDNGLTFNEGKIVENIDEYSHKDNDAELRTSEINHQ